MWQAEQILLERYQLQRNLGNNSGRQTWLAHDLINSQHHPHQVIIKLLAFSPQMEWEELKLFEREAQVLKTLDHPKIPRYLNYFHLDADVGCGLCWFALVQAYIPGKSLQEYLNSGDRLKENQLEEMTVQVLHILDYLHSLSSLYYIETSNLVT